MKNPVAKHARKYNTAKIHVDRKKQQKKGYVKHRKQLPPQKTFVQVVSEVAA